MTPDELKELGFEFDSKWLNLALDINKNISIVYYESGNILVRFLNQSINIGTLENISKEKLSAFIKSFKELYV